MKNKRIFNFAYGSNMSVDRLYARVGRVKVIGAYTIDNYALEFNCGWPPNQMYGNMVRRMGSNIEGVLYELTEEQIGELDKYECYPRNYTKIYFYDAAKDAIIFAYVATPWFETAREGKPQLDYINYLIKGSLEFNLNKTYEYLTAFKKANYKLKIKDKKKVSANSQASPGRSTFRVRNGQVVYDTPVIQEEGGITVIPPQQAV